VIYLNTQNILLLKHHLRVKNINYNYIELDNPTEVYNLLLLGSPLNKPVYLISYIGNKILDIQSKNKFNTIYLNTSSKSIKNNLFKKDWVELLNIDNKLYSNNYQKLKSLFELEAAEYFWNKFKDNPTKLNSELTNILIFVKLNKKKVSIEDLINLYEISIEGKLQYKLNKIGTLEFLNLVKNSNSAELWSFFIDKGSYPSTLENFFIKKKEQPEFLQGLL